MTDILVSVLLPTRNRIELVHRSVQSLLSKSLNPGRVEIITAYDEDDLASHNYFQGEQWRSLIKDFGAHSQVCCCPTWGYYELNRYYNAMAQQAHGQWFMIWNDDAVMLTSGWDQHVSDNQDFMGMLHMATENFKPTLTLFPLVSRIWLNLFGEISHHQITDSWIQDVCHQADAVREIPVSVFHDRYDVTGNNLDQTYLNRKYNKKGYNHESMQQVRSEWAQRFRQLRKQTIACDPMPHRI